MRLGQYLCLTFSVLLLAACGSSGPAPHASAPPEVVGVSPASSAGSSQVFEVSLRHPNGASQIVDVQLIIGFTPSGANACYVDFVIPGKQIKMRDDAGQTWIPPKNENGVLRASNSQCSVDVSQASSAVDGQVLKVAIPVQFSPAFTGPRKISVIASSNDAASPWKESGTWNGHP